jgi:hypothetical protein
VRRVLLLVLFAGLLVGANAVAQEGGSQGQEPSLDSAKVLQLPSDADCVGFTLVTVRILPPAGAVFGELRINVGGDLQARLTGVDSAASVTVRIGRRTDIAVIGTTLGGQAVRANRSYRRCRPAPAPRRAAPQPSPVLGPDDIVGGGEDG